MDEFENDMDEKLMVKLLTDVFKKLPPDSYLCVDILFDFVFKDGFLPELNQVKEVTGEEVTRLEKLLDDIDFLM